MKTAVVLGLLLLLVVSGTHANTVTIVSGGSCTAHADSGATSTAQNALVKALADASVVGCSATDPDQFIADLYRSGWKCGWASAIAKVQVAAVVKCHTFGPNSYGCAAAKAYAEADAQSWIKVIARAAAIASNSGCPRCSALYADAATFNFAKIFAELVAEANAKVKARVCVGPNQTASASAYVQCTAQVYAHGLAKAIAKAYISGDCTLLNADAKTRVLAIVKANDCCWCDGWVCADGSSTKCFSYTRPKGAGFSRLFSALQALAPKACAQLHQECYAAFYA